MYLECRQATALLLAYYREWSMTIRCLNILALYATVVLVVAGQAICADNSRGHYEKFDLVAPDQGDSSYGTFASIGGTGGTGPYANFVTESPGEAVTNAAPEAGATWTTVYLRHQQIIRPLDAAYVPKQLDDAPLSEIDLPAPHTPDDTFPEDETNIADILRLGADKPQDNRPVRFRDFFPSATSALIVALLGALLGTGITYWRIIHGRVQKPRKSPKVIK